MVKRIVILGSTGSIGRRAIDVIESLGDEYRIVGLAAGGNWKALADQARRVLPDVIAIADEKNYMKLKEEIVGVPIEVRAGKDAVIDLAGWSGADFILCAIPGAESIFSVLRAIDTGHNIGLASKEALVLAGSIVMEKAREKGVHILPVDSEHSAIFQSMQAGRREEINKIILTGTGGPFRDWPTDKIKHASLDQALAHPKWSMGRKVTIDSATMMNKALELIEAHHLFEISIDKIEILIHPEAIVHSLVEFCDGSQIAQLSMPDMAIPIAYTITWPERKYLMNIIRQLNLADVGKLSFYRPDTDKFPAIRLAYQVGRESGTAPAVFNAANEEAIKLFIERKIDFGQITELTERILNQHQKISKPNIQQLLEADTWARRKIAECVM